MATPNVVIRHMVKVIPEGYRRLILLSSLIAYLTNTDKPERDFVRNMDKALKLSRGGEQSLELPMRSSRVFWGNRELFKDEISILTAPNTSLCEKRFAAERVAARVPDWFSYGTSMSLIDDLLKYFTSQHPQQAEALPC